MDLFGYDFVGSVDFSFVTDRNLGRVFRSSKLQRRSVHVAKSGKISDVHSSHRRSDFVRQSQASPSSLTLFHCSFLFRC